VQHCMKLVADSRYDQLAIFDQCFTVSDSLQEIGHCLLTRCETVQYRHELHIAIPFGVL